MSRLALAGLAAVFLFAAAAPASAATAATPDPEPKVIALVFKADWCTACRVLEPKLMTVMPQVAAQPIRFVMLDQTDADARRAAATEARALGVAALYAAREGQTGYVLLVDASTKEVLGQIGSTDSVAQIRQKIRRALAAA